MNLCAVRRDKRNSKIHRKIADSITGPGTIAPTTSLSAAKWIGHAYTLCKVDPNSLSSPTCVSIAIPDTNIFQDEFTPVVPAMCIELDQL